MADDHRNGVGLVLSGGGGKGSYHIGVWRALVELGVASNLVAISGSSVGALNAAFVKQGNLEDAERLWRSLTPEDVLAAPGFIRAAAAFAAASFGGVPIINVVAPVLAVAATRGVFSSRGIKRLIDRVVNWTLVTSSDVPVFIAAQQIPSFCVRYFSLVGLQPHAARTRLLASAAIPILFEAQKIDGSLFIDPGILPGGDNTPVNPIYDHGCRVIIVVPLCGDDLLDVTRYSQAQIIPIFPQEDLGGLWNGTLDFDGSNAQRRMDQGYSDAMRVLTPIREMAETQAHLARLAAVAASQQTAWQRVRETWARLDKEWAKRDAEVAQMRDTARDYLSALLKHRDKGRP